MKNPIKYLSYIFLACFSLTFMGCNEKETDDISKITTYATFKMTGDEIISLGKGATYTEPGITAAEGSSNLDVTTSIQYAPRVVQGFTMAQADYQSVSSVDTNKEGLYTITYSATNSDGFPATSERLVFVHPSTPDPTVDLSGDYKSSTSPASEITKVADGVFYGTNIWGQGSTVRISGYIMTADGIDLSVPQQDTQTRIYGYGTRAANGTLNLKMSRPLFSPPLIDQTKDWVKQ